MTKDPELSRRQALASAGIAGGAFLAGCISMDGPSDETDTATETSGGQAPDEITGWSWDVAADGMSAVAEDYNPDSETQVTIEKLGNDTVHDRLRTSLLSGSGAPPFSSILTSELPAYVDEVGGLRDLSDWIEEDNLREEFVEARWPPAETEDGAIYALPWDISPAFTFYRRDVFDEHGIDPESIETWDDYIEEGKKLPEDVYMVNIDQQSMGPLWRMMFWQQGGTTFTEDGRVNINSEESVRIAQAIKRAYDEGVASNIGLWSSGWFTAYNEGTVASLTSGSWMAGTLQAELPETSGQWGAFAPPAFQSGGNRATNRGGTHHVIPEQVDDSTARAAWDFLKTAFTEPDNQIQLFEVSGIFPGLKSAWDDPMMEEELDFFGGQPIRQLAVDLAPDIPASFSYTPHSPVIGESIQTAFQEMLNGDHTPEEAVEVAAQDVAEQIDAEVA